MTVRQRSLQEDSMFTTTRALRCAALALAMMLSAACSGDDGAEVRKIDDDSGLSLIHI